MMKLHLFLLFILFLAGCSSDKDEQQPILVTNIVMPSQAEFSPGDKVTISAQGFQENDEVMFEMRWPLPDDPVLHEGYALGVRGIMIEKTVTSITFLAPGHYPASTVNILLRRSGQMMSLGKISVTDGQSPKELQLYGITNSHSDTGHANSIERIDIKTGKVTEVESLTDKPDFSCVVNSPGSNRLYGIWTKDGQRNEAVYDLSMNYWRMEDSRSIVTMGGAINGGLLAVYDLGTKLYIGAINDMYYSRMNNSTEEYLYDLPEGLKARALTSYPCVQLSDGYLLFSADNGDGTFSPVILSDREKKIQVFKSVKAKTLIPFWTVSPVVGQVNKYKRVGGYAIADEDGTKLQLWNLSTMTLEEPFATYPNDLRSLTTLISNDAKEQKLYALFNTNSGNGRLIYSYDLQKKEWKGLNSGYSYSEIVLAR